GMEFTNSTVDGNATFYIPEITYGNKTVVATYPGDDKYRFNSTTAKFTVNKRDSYDIIVNVTESINVGDVAQVNVTLPENATGQVVVKVDGKNYTINLTNGKGSVEIEGLLNGTYPVEVTYLGDDQYLSRSNNTQEIKVNKVPSTIIVTVDDITVGDVAAVNITVITNATGNVTIVIGDEYNKTVGVTDGLISVVVPGLSVGNKTVNVTYNGDDRFLPNQNSTNFTVGKTTAEIDLVVQNITYGEIETITAFINATGNVTIKLGDETLDTANIVDGKVEYDIDKLPAGNYTVEVIYNGDTNTNTTSIKANFTVEKIDPKIRIEVEDIIYGDVETIIVHVNTPGNVTIKVNGDLWYDEISLDGQTHVLRASRWAVPNTDETTTVEAHNLEVGKYIVEVTFNGNQNYTKATATVDFDVFKANTTVSIDVQQTVKVGETQVMNITINNTNATGNVTINIDGENYTAPITNGTGNFTIHPLASGNHSVVVIYEGDKNLNGNWTSATFEVEKLDIAVDLDDITDDIYVGSPVTFTARLNETVTGDVVFTINGANYTVHVSNDTVATYEYTPVNNDTLEVVATFMGNDEYNTNSTSKNFTVNKVPIEISVSVDEPIAYGDAAHVSIVLNETINAIVELVVDDKPYYVAVVNGKGEFNVSGLSTGGHVANVTFDGDDKYLGNSSSTTFTVSRANINETDIKVIDQGNGTVVVVVPSNATGNVTIKVGNNTYNGTIKDGIATIDLDNETPGTHDIEVIYSGDGNYAPANTTGTATIPKLATPIDVTVENIKVGDKETIVVTVPENATGNITIEINGVEYSEPIEDGIATFEIENLTAGNKTVAVDYVGDDNYVGNHTTANFTVSKVTPELKLNVTLDGDTATIDVEVPEDATKPVLIDVNGIGYYANITDGKGRLVLEDLAAGDYNVLARYPGDDKYTESDVKNDSFKVSGLPSTVSVKVDNITYGEDAVVEVTVPSDATGNVTVTIDGKPYEANVSGGKAVVIVPDLKAGNYTVDVTYNGDDKYKPSSNSTDLEVSPVQTDGLKVIDQGNGTVVVVVPDNATGNVTVKVGNNTYTAEVVNGTAVIDLVNETPGTYDIEVIYSGDENHTAANTTGTATIPKLATPIDIAVENIKVGDKETIVVTVPDDAKGNVTIEINGVEYTEEIKDGKATFEIENLTYGNKTVYVDYIGDNNYTGNHTSANFTVDKRKSSVKVDVEAIDVGEDAVITVTVPENATGYVIVEIDNQTYAIKVNDGTGSATIKGLASGDYPINVTYLGDDQYFNSTNATSLKVSKVPSSINVTVDDITVGENAVINVETPKDLCGNVTVSIDGENYTVPVSNGKGTLVVPDLAVGDHTVDVTFDGCKKYEPAENSTTFTVSKATTDESDIKVIDQGNGTVVVVVPDNATGTVEIKVGDNTYNATVENGMAVIDLVNETPGTYDIEVIYSGDENHTVANTTGTATIPKLATPIDVAVENIKVGDKEIIVVTVPDDAKGNVTIEIDGVKYTEEIKNGKATFEIENLTAGNKTVAVDYIGDNNYTGNHTTANFTVSKVTPEITVSVSDSKVGDKVIIEVTAPEDVTRPVLVDVGGKGYYVNITDGKGTLELDDLTSGDYDVTARYLGDDKYGPADDTDSFKVDKVPSTVSVDVDDITVGDKAVITVNVPEDATGTVTVTVDGKEYNVSVANGKGTLVIPSLKAGNYTVDAVYNGDDKYEGSDNSSEFEVSKVQTDDLKVIDQGNGTVVVVVPDNATGNVTIKVGDNTYSAEVVNGTAVIDLDNETPGTHDIEVIYSGDENHTAANTTGTATIPKVEAPISVDVDDIKVGDTAEIVVNVPEDATGTVTIEIDGVKYTEEIKDGKATFNVKDLTAGNKTIAVEYSGDDKYLANHTTSKITVSKRPSTVEATITDIDVGDNVTITVTVPDDATGQVLIDIDGVGYYVNVTNGKGTAEIPRMPNGVYNVNLTYTGDDKYLPSSNTSTFNVSKVESFVIPVAEDIYVGDVEVIKFTVPSDATGTLTVIIGGKEYNYDLDDGTLSVTEDDGEVFTVAVAEGKGELKVTGLPKGDYTVSVKYNGNEKYLPCTNTTTFRVLKLDSDMDVVDLGNGSVMVVLPEDATGNVTVKVGDNTYTAEVVNGTAIIDLTDETPGKHDISVIYSGDDSHKAQQEDSTATIPKYDTPISVEVEDINVGDTAIVTVTLPDTATGTVTVEINGKEYTATVKDGKAVFEITGLAAGDKTVAVKYYGDDNYVENSTTAEFTVSKVPSTIKASGKDITVGKYEIITVDVPADATGRVFVKIDGVGYYGDIENGKAKIVIPKLPSGKYKATVCYEGDDKYLPSETPVSFNVAKVKTPLKATGDEIEQGQEATVVVKLPSDATGTVTITIDGKKYTTEVKDGKAVFVIPGLKKGNYDVTASYSGDEKYEANDTITDVEVTFNDNGGENEDAEPVHGDGVDLTKHATGNPILVLLLILLAVGSTQIRRFRK
ncbi:Ig-like domain repeat protein, partial [Methanobrevibacter sp.]|uniref:Ig-like domain repeat protein n=1 Tax=Methanobrevibacter sp. TaxID=66852 RepID=UPI0038703ED1